MQRWESGRSFRRGCPWRNVFDEFHRHAARNESSRNAATEQLSKRTAATVAIVEGPVVDIHTHESIGLGPIEATRKPHCMVERLLAMLQSIRDTVAKMSRNCLH